MALNLKRAMIVDIMENMVDSPRAKKRKNQSRPNFFEDFDDEEFKMRFRLSKESVSFLLNEIESKIANKTSRNNAVLPKTMIFLALRFYASGSFLITCGDFCGVSVPTASRIVKKVSYAIAQLSSKFIKMPASEEEQNETKQRFYEITKFPLVLGCIDCTHIRLQSPGGENAEVFRNRKGYFSLNVQAICNANLEFLDLVARWPGSAHDSTIFSNSRIKSRLDSGEFNRSYILGDGGYALNKYLLTPVLNPQSRAHRLYNESQIRTRNTIERSFGVWKRCFPVLSMGIRVCLPTAIAIVVACGVLHNIARKHKESEPQIDQEISQSVITDLNIMEGTENLQDVVIDNSTRNNLIENYFLKL